MGAVLLKTASESSEPIESQVNSWALALFIPVLGPAYTGGRLAFVYTQAAVETKYMTGLAFALAPLAYGAALVAMLDGVMQGYGLFRILTSERKTVNELLRNSEFDAIRSRSQKFSSFSLAPNVSCTALGFDVSGRF